ncbi:hypothetical protein HMPREF0658_0904 [Hoylesella marshii DSM 16973 = JCM 13450]|uniref:Uncharacterized protein n=1 Tax=Hoylesella marshii DSM 16973 = JCM 13450 TaxID=862515 RepID=E0NRV3_9BACT|nr:hypothetical protein HMPREF0658_0904 [Hoylesella marshii DSM 16973 = JCM 13450]
MDVISMFLIARMLYGVHKYALLALFCDDSLVFDAQKFEIVFFHGRNVTIDKSASVPCTDGVCA